MMKAAGFICLMVIPCFLWDGKSLIFPFVLLIGRNVRGAKEAGLVHLELAYLNRFTFFCHGESLHRHQQKFCSCLIFKMKRIGKGLS